MAKDPLTPAAIDVVRRGQIRDPLTAGLRIEVLSSGKKHWKFRRRMPRSQKIIKLNLGPFPTYSIAEARTWARELNEQIEGGIDPRQAQREEEARASMTVSRAHGLYMTAVREGRSSRAKRLNKPRTISDKLEIYEREIAPSLAKTIIYEVTEADLVRLVIAKGRTAKVRANRLAAELRVFFGWASSLRGTEVGLEVDPSRRLGDLRFPETPRSRRLSHHELECFLRALVPEELVFRRGMLLWLLTAARLAEIVEARASEFDGEVWTIPASRTKNSIEHRIALGPWGRSLMHPEGDWLFAAPKREGFRSRSSWYRARDRVKARMEKLSGQPIERFTPHDFRRTARSNTKRLRVDYETAEAMLNHVKKGLERTYDCYELEDEKKAVFLKWEAEIANIAYACGVAEVLGLPGSGPHLEQLQ